MSYILDALRRAEADRERERGQVPGLHTQASSDSVAAPARRRWLPWAGGGLLLLAGIGAGSWLTSSPREAVAPAPPPVPAPAPVAAPAPSPVSPPAVSAPAPQPAASASPYLAPPPPPGAVIAAPAPVQAPVPAPAPAVEAPIPRLADLPESLRRELPKLAISGSVYSDDPASRFVMVNGEVAREGARLGADLVLERIGPRELVLRFKGQRFRQPI
jgi:general secretion pathway protein B